MKNWKTSLFGSLATVGAGLATQLPDGTLKNIVILASAIFGALFAFFSKDSNVTGGTTPQ